MRFAIYTAASIVAFSVSIVLFVLCLFFDGSTNTLVGGWVALAMGHIYDMRANEGRVKHG